MNDTARKLVASDLPAVRILTIRTVKYVGTLIIINPTSMKELFVSV